MTRILLLLSALALSGCDIPGACLQDGEIGEVIRVQNMGPPTYSNEWQRLTIQRDKDKTVCTAGRRGWYFQVGDKVRGLM